MLTESSLNYLKGGGRSGNPEARPLGTDLNPITNGCQWKWALDIDDLKEK